MWLSTLLFIFYAIICSFFVCKNGISKRSGIPIRTILFLFFWKLCGGLLYHYFNTIRFYGGDSHQLFLETCNYLNSDSTYFWNYFWKGWSGFHADENIFSLSNSKSWSNLSNQINYRILTICNVLSFKTEVVNYVFYNSLFFIGQIGLFTVFQKYFPTRKTVILLFIFITPSIWFWCSGVHKDGFVLSFIGLLLYYTMRYLETKHLKYFLFTILFLFASISIRYYIIIALLPCFIFYITSIYYPKYSAAIFGVGILLFVIIFFNISSFIDINPPQIICFKQAEFLSGRGKSFIPTAQLQPNALSFLQQLPSALNHCLMRPYLWESKNARYLACSIETILLFAFLITLTLQTPRSSFQHPLFLFCICFSIIMFIIIGYIVPFSGAFIRYRSEYFPFIYSVLIGASKWKFLQKLETKLLPIFSNN